MKSKTTGRFRKAFGALPKRIQDQARASYRLFQKDPSHGSLQFKPIQSKDQIYSVRVTQGYRALGVRVDDTIVWFWIGSHSDYEKLI